jgi:ankyrin repeat protein
MCKNATRRIIWDDASKVDLQPLFVRHGASNAELEAVSLDITTSHVTTSEEYQIFSSLRAGNYSNVVELIENHVGVNAVDEWGQSPLMIAVQLKHLPVIAALLNTRLPKVDVNAAKPVSMVLILVFELCSFIKVVHF